MDLSEKEAETVKRFGFDKAPDIPELSSRIAIRAAHIAQLAAELLSEVS